ncbi:hypothetical protein F5Y15DRAFT_383647 [Xylariaceae sp. FL0016]|nr:hypothetical protein F5Y15DRAFT_383647 [Xylariaceae sp. FL0016]
MSFHRYLLPTYWFYPICISTLPSLLGASVRYASCTDTFCSSYYRHLTLRLYHIMASSCSLSGALSGPVIALPRSHAWSRSGRIPSHIPPRNKRVSRCAKLELRTNQYFVRSWLDVEEGPWTMPKLPYGTLS